MRRGARASAVLAVLGVGGPHRAAEAVVGVVGYTGTLFPPVTGRFTDGVGEFYGADTHNDTPVRVRFIWSDITGETAHWEQAFSTDDGKTWITNWHMELTRRP